LGERKTEDLDVPGSIPGEAIFALWRTVLLLFFFDIHRPSLQSTQKKEGRKGAQTLETGQKAAISQSEIGHRLGPCSLPAGTGCFPPCTFSRKKAGRAAIGLHPKTPTKVYCHSSYAKFVEMEDEKLLTATFVAPIAIIASPQRPPVQPRFGLLRGLRSHCY
jgi:hypothetical protein